MPKELDPNGIDAKTLGAKMDAGKAPIMQGVIQYFPRALKAVSMVSLAGSKKYAWKGWEKVPDGVNRYSDALGRHLLAETTEGPIDPDTGTLHAAQIAWNALARLELMLRDQEPKPGAIIGVTDEQIKAGWTYEPKCSCQWCIDATKEMYGLPK